MPNLLTLPTVWILRPENASHCYRQKTKLLEVWRDWVPLSLLIREEAFGLLATGDTNLPLANTDSSVPPVMDLPAKLTVEDKPSVGSRLTSPHQKKPRRLS